MLRPEPGTYALILRSIHPASVQVGRLGELRLERGFYVYLGSARGPGGLGARIEHHRRAGKRPHWHIDYLRARTRLEGVWFCYDARCREHQWAGALSMAEKAAKPLAGFGASDCRCETHLYFLHHQPSLRRFIHGLRAIDRSHPPLEEWAP